MATRFRSPSAAFLHAAKIADRDPIGAWIVKQPDGNIDVVPARDNPEPDRTIIRLGPGKDMSKIET